MSDMKRKTALRALIEETLRRNQWTAEKRIDWAVANGYEIGRTQVSDFRGGKFTYLSPERIIALAAVLDLPVERVAVAALADLGIQIPQDVATPEEAVQHDHTLTAYTRQRLLDLIEQDRALKLPPPRRKRT